MVTFSKMNVLDFLDFFCKLKTFLFPNQKKVKITGYGEKKHGIVKRALD